MIPLVVNVNLLREIDERKLINTYAHFMYNDEKDISDEVQIKENLIQLLDWDKNGDNGLGIYCSHFESIKNKDWNKLITFIKENHHEIKVLSYSDVKNRKLESIKIVNDALLRAEKTEMEANMLRRNVTIFKRRLKDIVEAQLEIVNDIEKVEL